MRAWIKDSHTMNAPNVAASLILCALLAACTEVPPLHADANTPGYTGRTIVLGDSSTIADDAEATYMQQKGAYGPG
jgi:hypothetical protein